MDANERLKIEQECRDLVTKLNHYHDHRRAEEAAALFAKTGAGSAAGVRSAVPIFSRPFNAGEPG